MEANTTNEISIIQDLGARARALRIAIDVNMWELARVFVDAKELVPHGEWGRWLKDNADVSERTAQDMMAAYRRFGGRPQFEGIGKTSLFKLLPLPEDREEEFLQTHDVQRMSSREVEDAVRQAREEANRELMQERQMRMEAEERANTIPVEIADELRENRDAIERQRQEISRLTELGRTSLEEQRRLTRENAELQDAAREREEMLEEQQDALNRAQEELLNLQSAQAREDAERVPADVLSGSAFAGAVRSFVGTCARMPMMRGVFARMGHAEWEEWDVLLRTVEKWASESRKALDAAAGEGVVA